MRQKQSLFEELLLPHLDGAYNLARWIESNRQDFAALLGNFLDVLNLNLERRRELADHESTLARLERLTGVTLP